MHTRDLNERSDCTLVVSQVLDWGFRNDGADATNKLVEVESCAASGVRVASSVDTGGLQGETSVFMLLLVATNARAMQSRRAPEIWGFFCGRDASWQLLGGWMLLPYAVTLFGFYSCMLPLAGFRRLD